MQNQFLPAETTVETTLYVTPSVTVEPLETTETPISTQAVTAVMAQTQRKIRRRNVKYWGAFALMQTLVALAVACVMLYSGHANDPGTLKLTLFMLMSMFFPLGILLLLRRMPTDFDSETLARMGGTNAIPALLDSFTANASPAHRKTTLNALTMLLPQLQATDAPRLTPGNRHALNSLLNTCFAPSLWTELDQGIGLSILKAYEQVGDAKAIPVVERLANWNPLNERQRKIRQAAADCLPLLRAHVGSLNVTQTLLRPSALDTNTPNTLLRAAASSTPTPEAELLRAINSDITHSSDGRPEISLDTGRTGAGDKPLL